MSDVTHILSQIDQGDRAATDQLLPLVYDELRRLAAQRLAAEPSGQTLQPTALVHEAYIRLVDVDRAQQWDSVGHFFAAAAQAMRRILVDNARRKQAQRHGGGRCKLSLEEVEVVSLDHPERIIMLDESLSKLAEEDQAAAEVVKLRMFAGLSVEQAGQHLGMSRATAYRHWIYARAWLLSDMQ